MTFSNRMAEALMAEAEADSNLTEDERRASDTRYREDVKVDRSEKDAEIRALAREHSSRRR
jgi:hypothetical protein